MQNSKPRMVSIDLMKSMAIFFVVFYHYCYLPIDFIKHPGFVELSNYFILSILSACVPLFFFANGFLIFPKKEFNLKAHIAKIIRIIIITVLWGIITVGVLSYLSTDSTGFMNTLSDAVSGKSLWVSHLWFMGALVITYIFYPLLYVAYKSYRPIFYFFLASVFLFTFGNEIVKNILVVLSYFSDRFLTINLSINYFSIFNPFRGIPAFVIVYFMMGGVLFALKDKIKKLNYLKIIALPAILLYMLLIFSYYWIYSLREHVTFNYVWDSFNSLPALIMVFFIFVLFQDYRPRGV